MRLARPTAGGRHGASSSGSIGRAELAAKLGRMLPSDGAALAAFEVVNRCRNRRYVLRVELVRGVLGTPKVEQLVQARFSIARAKPVLHEPRKKFKFFLGGRHNASPLPQVLNEPLIEFRFCRAASSPPAAPGLKTCWSTCTCRQASSNSRGSGSWAGQARGLGVARRTFEQLLEEILRLGQDLQIDFVVGLQAGQQLWPRPRRRSACRACRPARWPRPSGR